MLFPVFPCFGDIRFSSQRSQILQAYETGIAPKSAYLTANSTKNVKELSGGVHLPVPDGLEFWESELAFCWHQVAFVTHITE